MNLCVCRDTSPVVADKLSRMTLPLVFHFVGSRMLRRDAFLVSGRHGRGARAERAHPDDPDQRCVVLRWDVVSYALMGPPNDEARNQHRLYEAGLKDVDRLGVVRHSSLVAGLRPMFGRDAVFVPLHYVVVSKECVVEVLAETTLTCSASAVVRAKPHHRALARSRARLGT